MISENMEEYCGLPVVDFDNDAEWQGPDVAYRVRVEYDDERKMSDLLAQLASKPEAAELKALVIGSWDGACEGDDVTDVVKSLLPIASKLSGLKALFIGDITYEECEISWIKQSDMSPVLNAFKGLEVFGVRGGDGLSFSQVSHPSLKSLRVETGGMPRSVVRQIFLSDFPALESLELLFGEENYGFDGSVEDLQPLLSGALFPKLKRLGLMNSELTNEIAAVVVNSPIIDRLEVLDLSMGTLDDSGVAALKSLAGKSNLKTLDLTHHYATEEALEDLRATLSCEVIADEPQEADDDWRPVLHAE